MSDPRTTDLPGRRRRRRPARPGQLRPARLPGIRPERGQGPRPARRLRRPEAGAAPHPVLDVAHGPGLRRRRRRQAGQERARGRRRAGPLPPARRPGRLRRAGAHGAGLQPALPADRRPGQLRQPRRRRRRGHALHRGAAGARSPACCSTRSTRARSTSRPTTTARTQEPLQLPARLPFALLNGASGIAVGLATEIPSHNLREVADACVALMKNAKLTDDELFALLPGPGLSRRRPDHQQRRRHRATPTARGRGSLKVRARWKIEDLARGQWQLVVHRAAARRQLAEACWRRSRSSPTPRSRPARRRCSQEQLQLKADRAGGAGRGARRVEQGRRGAPGVRAQDQPHRAAAS